jgi:plastocyanin
MIRPIHNLAMTGALALAALAPASAQFLPAPSSPGTPAGLRNIIPFTGLQIPGGFLPPSIPSNWVSPSYPQIYYYPVPVYVPVPVMPEVPAVQPVQVTIVTLRESATQEVRVKAGSAVTWVNASNRERTLIVEPVSPTGGSTAVSTGNGRQSGTVRPNDTFSLAFNQPGTYDYYLQDQQQQRARVIVEQ